MFRKAQEPQQGQGQEPVNVTVYLNAPMIFPSTAPEPEPETEPAQVPGD